MISNRTMNHIREQICPRRIYGKWAPHFGTRNVGEMGTVVWDGVSINFAALF